MRSSEIDPQHLSAFVDGELDVLRMGEIEAHMQHDEGLRREVQELRQLRQHVRSLADYHVAPEAFHRRIASLGLAPATASARLAVGTGTLPHWLDWRQRGGSFAALALVVAVAVAILTLNQTRWRSGEDDRLAQEVVASHVRSTLGEHLVDVASSDHHTVKPWLSSKLDFSPAVQESLLPGSVFLGGRVDYLGGRPVAALVYRQGPHVVNSFVWPTQAGDARAQFLADRGFQIAHWSRNGMLHWVISDLNREEFGALVRTLELDSSAR